MSLPVALVLFGGFILLLAVNVPIAAALGLSSIITIWWFELVGNWSLVASTMMAATEKWTLLAIPFFILAGHIMSKTVIASRLTELAETLIGQIAGGLGIVTIVVAIFFAGISGSGPADTAALGALLIPAMVAAGYKPRFAAALTAAGGGIGIIVPPSIALVIYGAVSGVSIAKLFIAGIIPGIIVGLLLIIFTYGISVKEGYRARRKRGSLKEVLFAVKRSFWALLAPVIILGGIFTPTEAAVMAIIYALIVGLFIYRDIKFRDLPEMFYEAGSISAVVMLIVAAASLFSWILDREGIAEGIAGGFLALGGNKIMLLLLINFILIAAGCFMDAISIFYIFIPILLPVVLKLGVDPLHFGIIMTTNLAIGQITPPVGVNLFVAAGIARISFKEIAYGIAPLFIAEVIALLLITFIPELSTWLPSFMASGNFP